MADHTLGTIRGTIEIDYDGAGIVKAIRDVDKVKKSGDKLDGMSNKVLNAFGKFAKGASLVAGAVNLAHTAITGIAGALAIVGPLASAGLAAAPGVIFAAAAAMGVFKLATVGVGEALKAAGGSAEKFKEAIKNLSPEAQKFAKAVRAAMPELKAFQQGIQDSFFQGADRQVGKFVAAVQAISGPARAVAAVMGQIARDIVNFVTQGKTINGVKTILGGVYDFLQNINGTLGPLVQSFIGLAAQAGQFGGTLGGAVAASLTKLADFMDSIDLKALFAAALPIVKSLGSFLADVGAIAGQLFSVFSTDGANAAGILADLASQLREFLSSAQGQAALQALGTALSAISTGAGQVFLALLQALAPALVALAPGVTTLATQLSGVLVTAINVLSPLLTSLAGFLSDNMGWIGPLAGAVVVLAGAYKVYAAATAAVTAVQTVLQSKMVGAIAVWTLQKIAILGSTAATMAHAVVTGGAAVAAWIANTAVVVANRVALLAGAIAMNVVRAATIAWTAVQWLLNAALTANPIGLVVAGIALLVAGIILAWRNSETFRNVVLAVWGAIKSAIGAVVSWITSTVWPSLQRAWQQIASGAQTLWGWIKAAWNGIRNAIATALNATRAISQAIWGAIVATVRAYINLIRTVITTGINAAKAVWTAALNAIRSVAKSVWAGIVSVVTGYINRVKAVIGGIRAIVATVRNAFNSARAAAASSLSSLFALVRSVPGRVAGALGNLGSLLYSKGQSLVRGFISGIASMIGAVADKARSVVSAVTRFLPGSPAKEGPLSGKGYVLLRARRFMKDFAQGINDGSEKPAAALMGAVNPLARATVPAGSSTKSGASAAPSVAPATGGMRTYKLAIGGKELAEFVVDAVTGAPVAVSKAADEGSRRTAWAGSGR